MTGKHTLTADEMMELFTPSPGFGFTIGQIAGVYEGHGPNALYTVLRELIAAGKIEQRETARGRVWGVPAPGHWTATAPTLPPHTPLNKAYLDGMRLARERIDERAIPKAPQ